MTDEQWMGFALEEAALSLAEGEVPIGAVVVREGAIIGRGRNAVERLKRATAHAELMALDAAAVALGDWRLDGCTLYATVEPCHMCLGACYLSRVARVAFGARQPRSGSCGSVDDFHEADLFNHRLEIRGGIREEECTALLRRFFGALRVEDDGRRDARAG